MKKHKHYCKNYDKITRFISYYHQINLIHELNPNKILEIGVGNKTVSDYLKRHEFNIKTCDIDKKLNPDVIGDIRKLPFKKNAFDLILASEILEHIPYDDVEKALKELHRVTKKYVIISVPYSQIYFGCSITFPLISRIFNKEFFNLFIGVPSRTKIKFDGEHYWELGRKGYSIKKVRKDISKYFNIIEEKRALPYPIHYFFVLEKKE
jgi:ubiquinone/menaquinone biosynthesis C-methylase UbiE